MPEKLEGLAEELRCNNEARIAFEFEQVLQSFWMCRAVRILQLEATNLLVVFPTTYLCEQGFSALANVESKYCNRLVPEDCFNSQKT